MAAKTKLNINFWKFSKAFFHFSMYFHILKIVINWRYKYNFVLFQKCISKCPYHMLFCIQWQLLEWILAGEIRKSKSAFLRNDSVAVCCLFSWLLIDQSYTHMNVLIMSILGLRLCGAPDFKVTHHRSDVAACYLLSWLLSNKSHSNMIH